jgi:hypothetical protein
MRQLRHQLGRVLSAISATRPGRLTTATWHFARLPKWLLIVFAACLVIPGPLDELAFCLVVLALVLWQLRTQTGRSAYAAAMRVAWAG